MANKKIRITCQSGGEFEADEDGSLSYRGGNTHIIDIDDQMNFDEFKKEITKNINVSIDTMSIKYILPIYNKIPITVSNDKDLKRMIKFLHGSDTAPIQVIVEVIAAPDVSNVPASRTTLEEATHTSRLHSVVGVEMEVECEAEEALKLGRKKKDASNYEATRKKQKTGTSVKQHEEEVWADGRRVGEDSSVDSSVDSSLEADSDDEFRKDTVHITDDDDDDTIHMSSIPNEAVTGAATPIVPVIKNKGEKLEVKPQLLPNVASSSKPPTENDIHEKLARIEAIMDEMHRDQKLIKDVVNDFRYDMGHLDEKINDFINELRDQFFEEDDDGNEVPIKEFNPYIPYSMVKTQYIYPYNTTIYSNVNVCT